MALKEKARNEFSRMSFRDTPADIKEFLDGINLGRYFAHFQAFGYNTWQDCTGFNDSMLQQIGISPTGHRRRILKQLQVLFSKMRGKPADVESHSSDPHVLNVNEGEIRARMPSEQTSTVCGNDCICEINQELADSESQELKGILSDSSCQTSDCSTDASVVTENALEGAMPEMVPCIGKPLEKGQTEPASAQPEDTPKENSLPDGFDSSEMKSGEEEPLMESGPENSPGGSPDSQFVEFKGKMVENDLYGPRTQNLMKAAPRTTRSFMLRHRPVPQVPDSSKAAAAPSSLQERRNLNGLNISCSESLLSEMGDSTEEKPPPISPYGETFLFNSTEDAEICGSERLSLQDKDRDDRSAEKNTPPSKTCTPVLNNQTWKMNEETADSKLAPIEDKYALPNRFVGEPQYSMVKKCARYTRRGKYKPYKNSNKELKSGNLDFPAPLHISSIKRGIISVSGGSPVPRARDSISPYACFYGSTLKKVKEGWLDKLSPQGKHMFQKRWVKFDGDNISYYNNEKEVYSKGIILLSAVSAIRVHGDIKFELVTAQRIFVFRAEKEDERNDWMQTILGALRLQPEISGIRNTIVPSEKSGYLELKGYKAKIFTLLQGNHVWICKSEQDFKTGYGITVIPMNVANVKQVDRTAKQSFEIITPYRSFSFTAESEKEKQEWIEVLQESIAETLSDYEVAEKIWFNDSNRTCADCKAPDPDWASVNLCVIICKKCAGQHRSLGPRDSKVRSLKMDASVWSNELIELFIVLGNKRANSFWEGNLQPDEELPMNAATQRRLTFITQKYKEGKFRKTALLYKTKEELNKALCAAVVKQDVLETMTLLFSGADVMCATGDPVYSTPYLLAKKAGQRLQMEFLHHNKFSDFPNYDAQSNSVSFQDTSSTFLCEYLYKLSFNAAKLLTERKLKEECNKRWCALESGFLSYYENDKTASPNGMIDISEVICLVVHKADSFLHAGAIFTFEIYLLSERVFLFGAEAAHSQRKWTQAIAKHFVPDMAKCLLDWDYDVIGQLYYKDCHNLDNWKKGWFAIEKSNLHFCLELEDAQEELIHLRRLQELTISSIIQNGEKIDVLLLVEKGRTLYIHGHTKLDFTVWHSAIEKAAGTDGNILEDQQLSKNDVPIIVNSCIAFVTQYGLGSKHIYLNSGDPSHVSTLLECFKKDARSVKLRAGTNRLEDVTEALKCFLSEIDDALLTKQLYPFWISVLDTVDEKVRVRKYSTFIRTLPSVNRATLAALIEHLYRVQKCSEINHMDPHNLAMAFSSCLFQTKGQTSEEVNVIEDLIINYVHLFDVHEDQVKQMDIENSFITKWKDTQVSQAGDMLVEVYVERKEPDCSAIIKVSPMMEAGELTSDILGIKNITPHQDDKWAAFEVIENGELERPLHYTENVLEQILHWSSLPNPRSACLIIKKFLSADTRILYNEKNTEGSIKASYLKYKEEPSKLLSGNKFQERYFVLREGNLFLYKDMKSTKPEKELPVKSLKLYLGVKKKVKPPTNWGLTLSSEKNHWYLCCDGRDSQLEWLSSLFIAQHSSIWPPHGKIRKQSTRKNPRIGGLSLIPIQHERSPPKTKVNNLENSKLDAEGELAEDKKGVKHRVPLITHCLERKEEKAQSCERKHRSMISLEGTGEDIAHLHQDPHMESQSPKPNENKGDQMPLDSDKQLLANVIQELNTILQKHKSSHKET
ncbi:arf-GAP with Rho-GAP domain, ANK repeat and PH domain-containing protein 2 isoform X3 [Sphaerodactylus townsendi]|uniref:arf-GAP with Rho-GAP domain, ANK repeat and PH domain-containing protein 2 isoform X3 n=1 Tax=Sphaerodactylus townsendi TaxID=933632 RepID=UPI0020261B28|nr:arf-GAP with Rho-GAP domain, ANK repeat and PH domain-containing protein 2 isoform X3 [Sphaerodactylus townsendi]